MQLFKKMAIVLVALVILFGSFTAVIGIVEVTQPRNSDSVDLSSLRSGESMVMPLAWSGNTTIWFCSGYQTQDSGSTAGSLTYFSGSGQNLVTATATSSGSYIPFSASSAVMSAVTALNLRISKTSSQYVFRIMDQSDVGLVEISYDISVVQQSVYELEGLQLYVRVGQYASASDPVVSQSIVNDDLTQSQDIDNVVGSANLTDENKYIIFAFQAPPITQYVEGIYNDFYLYDIGQEPQKINGVFTYINTDYHPGGVDAGYVSKIELSFGSSGSTMQYTLFYSRTSTTYTAAIATRYGNAFISFISHVRITVTEYKEPDNILWEYSGEGNPFESGGVVTVDDVYLWNVEYVHMQINFEAQGYSAYVDGREDGYEEGFLAGEDAGYETGYTAGEQFGYNDGYNAGYAVGVKEVQPSASTMVASAGQLLNADIFGTWSLADILTIMIGLACVIAFLKLFAGG